MHIFWKKVRESLSRPSVNEFNLAANSTLWYDMLPVKLKMICRLLLVIGLIPDGEIEHE